MQKKGSGKSRSQVGHSFTRIRIIQIIGTSVEEDVAFGPENKKYRTGKIREKLGETVFTKVKLWDRRKQGVTFHIIRRTKQRLATADCAACRTSGTSLVLDEPTAMLDRIQRKEVINIVKESESKEGN